MNRAQQEKLTPELEGQIINCETLTELEDIYLPYKPKSPAKGEESVQRYCVNKNFQTGR